MESIAKLDYDKLCLCIPYLSTNGLACLDTLSPTDNTRLNKSVGIEGR
jgi:hypothetical protein